MYPLSISSFQFRPSSASAGGGHEGYAHIQHGIPIHHGEGGPRQPQSSHHRSGVRYSSQPQLNQNAILDFGEVNTTSTPHGLRAIPNTSKDLRLGWARL